MTTTPTPALQPLAPGLSLEAILKIVAAESGKRINLSQGDIEIYVAVARAVEREATASLAARMESLSSAISQLEGVRASCEERMERLGLNSPARSDKDAEPDVRALLKRAEQALDMAHSYVNDGGGDVDEIEDTSIAIAEFLQAQESAPSSELSVETILEIVADNTGKRISLSNGDLDCYIAVVRAALARRATAGTTAATSGARKLSADDLGDLTMLVPPEMPALPLQRLDDIVHQLINTCADLHRGMQASPVAEALRTLCDQLDSAKKRMRHTPGTGQNHSYLLHEDVEAFVEEARKALPTEGMKP